MIVDFRTFPHDTVMPTDICVIGAGPAGLAIAREFFGTATSVTLLESGGLGFNPASESLNAGQSVGVPHNGLTDGRRRQFGGAANIWGAVCVELEPSDFDERPWIPIAGWPIGAADVAPFYARARTMFELPRTDFGASDWREFGMQTSAFDPHQLRYSVVASTPISDLGKAYRREFAAARNVKVVVHATVTSLKTNADGTSMDAVEIQTLNGRRGTIRARAFVLACGGIENARLLLVSRDTHRNGLGNGHDLVGRYLADHTFSFSARIQPAPEKALQPFFRVLRRNGSNLRPRLSLPAERQAAGGVLNCMAQVVFKHAPDSGFAGALNLREAIRFRRMPQDLTADLSRIARHPRELAAMAFDRYLRGDHPAGDRAEAWLQCMCEQAPGPDSRVMLSNRTDRFGLPLPIVDWRVGEIERKTIAFMTHTVAAEFQRLGLGDVVPEDWLTADAASGWRSRLVEGYHHMGTTRMSADARSGVVDADAAVHGVAGLYVAGTSIFPAAGYANPTLAIVALAIRLADQLKIHLRPATVGAGSPAA